VEVASHLSKEIERRIPPKTTSGAPSHQDGLLRGGLARTCETNLALILVGSTVVSCNLTVDVYYLSTTHERHRTPCLHAMAPIEIRKDLGCRKHVESARR